MSGKEGRKVAPRNEDERKRIENLPQKLITRLYLCVWQSKPSHSAIILKFAAASKLKDLSDILSISLRYDDDTIEF